MVDCKLMAEALWTERGQMKCNFLGYKKRKC